MLSILRRIYNSIALLPTGIALFFALAAIGQILFSFEATAVPDFLDGIVIEQKSALQFIFAYIIGGIFTLTIFSYTMVMNVLNRSISNYSPRLIPLILAERHHQLILGFTSGTIIYSMIMSVACSGNGMDQFPPLGAFMGVLFSIFCVFLFIYFIHSVSQSIHINYILRKSFDRSFSNLEKWKETECLGYEHQETSDFKDWEVFKSSDCGYLQLPDIESLAALAENKECHISIEHLPGVFVLRNEILIRTSKSVKSKNHNFSKQVSIDARVPLELNETEIKHLVEVGIKAASPAINDPGTSLTAIDYITQLLILRNELKGYTSFSKNGKHFVHLPFLSTKELSEYCFTEMWNYMNEDPILIKSMKNAIHKLNLHGIDISHRILN